MVVGKEGKGCYVEGLEVRVGYREGRGDIGETEDW